MALSKKTRVKIQRILRKTRLLSLAEQLRYRSKVFSLSAQNKKFITANPTFALPPKFLAFDAYSAPDWTFYKSSGEGTAQFLADLAKEYLSPQKPIESIYEWGCGPARVVRHLPAALGEAVAVYGSDYNEESIAWCSKSIPDVQFAINQLNPPLPYPDNHFDFIYSISVFTHLSEATGLQWVQELYRVLKPSGILVITTSGDNAYQNELLEEEKKKYDNEGVVVRGDYEEGKKMYLARHNPKYVREKLLYQFNVLKHVPAGFPFIEQDYWVARKVN